MNKVISISRPFAHLMARAVRSQVFQDIVSFWAVLAFVLAVIFFSEIAAAFVLITRNMK